MQIDAEFLDYLEKYNWSGNVRELKNVIERAVILADGNILTSADLPYEILNYKVNSAGKTLSAFAINSIEKLHIQKVLNYTNGNKAETARLLEIGIATLYRKIEEYKI